MSCPSREIDEAVEELCASFLVVWMCLAILTSDRDPFPRMPPEAKALGSGLHPTTQGCAPLQSAGPGCACLWAPLATLS